MNIGKDTNLEEAKLTEEEIQACLSIAKIVSSFSYSPYTNNKCGVAILLNNSIGVCTGCLVENASYPLSSCAIRNAMSNAITFLQPFISSENPFDLENLIKGVFVWATDRESERNKTFGEKVCGIEICGGCRDILKCVGNLAVFVRKQGEENISNENSLSFGENEWKETGAFCCEYIRSNSNELQPLFLENRSDRSGKNFSKSNSRLVNAGVFNLNFDLSHTRVEALAFSSSFSDFVGKLSTQKEVTNNLIGATGKECIEQEEEEAKMSEEEAKMSEEEAKMSEEEAKKSEEEAKMSDEKAKMSDEKAKKSEEEAKMSEGFLIHPSLPAKSAKNQYESISLRLVQSPFFGRSPLKDLNCFSNFYSSTRTCLSLFTKEDVHLQNYCLNEDVILHMSKFAYTVAMNFAFCNHSNFRVGSTLLTDKGLFWGTNFEATAFSLGMCAEKNAINKAIAANAKSIEALFVIGIHEKIDKNECNEHSAVCTPCGGCRQTMVEFGNFPVFCLARSEIKKRNEKNELKVQELYQYECWMSEDLLPNSFKGKSL